MNTSSPRTNHLFWRGSVFWVNWAFNISVQIFLKPDILVLDATVWHLEICWRICVTSADPCCFLIQLYSNKLPRKKSNPFMSPNAKKTDKWSQRWSRLLLKWSPSLSLSLHTNDGYQYFQSSFLQRLRASFCQKSMASHWELWQGSKVRAARRTFPQRNSRFYSFII